jgi:sec-independent protein translocase protein TatC
LLFQIPLVLVIINRIKPLNPRKLFGFERWVIVIAFIVAMLMAPTVNIFDQLVIAGPIIIAYQIGISLVRRMNQRPKRPKFILALLEQDRLNQAERMQRVVKARLLLPTMPDTLPPGNNSRPLAII